MAQDASQASLQATANKVQGWADARATELTELLMYLHLGNWVPVGLQFYVSRRKNPIIPKCIYM